MGVIQQIRGFFNTKSDKIGLSADQMVKGTSSQFGDMNTSSHYGGYQNSYPVVTEFFDGEKTTGELGYYINSIPNYEGLRYRSYDANLKSDIVKIITGRFFDWVVGSGLKLNSTPKLRVLKTEGLVFENLKEFSNDVEARFHLFMSSKKSDFSKKQSLHEKGSDTHSTGFLGGDCLIILRVDDKLNLTVQMIDGQDVKTPFLDEKMIRDVASRGNTIDQGIEIDKNGKHISFFVIQESEENIFGKFTRVLSEGKKTGRTMAWMYYGEKHRPNHNRGIPTLTPILEKVDKLDRYIEASVGSAEERAKIVFSIEHDKESDGENVLLSGAKNAAGRGGNASEDTSGYLLGEKTAQRIAITTSKQTFNMPVGATLKALESSAENQFEDFSKAVFTYLCAAVKIPVEVALQSYNSNYSASRAAINGWGHVVEIRRKKHTDGYDKPIFEMWLEIEIIKGKIKAPGFIKAVREKNFTITESFTSCTFKGVNMPHIDPLKEVKAVREMLGVDNKDPLISRELGAEMLGVGNWDRNFENYQSESEIIPKEKIEEPVNNGNKNQVKK